MDIRIYQPKNPTFHVDETVKKYDRAEYREVYSTNTKDYFGNSGIEHKIALELLFEDMNRAIRPRGYKGYSMSVGDLVEIGNSLYICQNFGWGQVEWRAE